MYTYTGIGAEGIHTPSRRGHARTRVRCALRGPAPAGRAVPLGLPAGDRAGLACVGWTHGGHRGPDRQRRDVRP